MQECIVLHPLSLAEKRSALAGDSDDDGLPNTYDYNDSFIDDDDASTGTIHFCYLGSGGNKINTSAHTHTHTHTLQLQAVVVVVIQKTQTGHLKLTLKMWQV